MTCQLQGLCSVPFHGRDDLSSRFTYSSPHLPRSQPGEEKNRSDLTQLLAGLCGRRQQRCLMCIYRKAAISALYSGDGPASGNLRNRRCDRQFSHLVYVHGVLLPLGTGERQRGRSCSCWLEPHSALCWRLSFCWPLAGSCPQGLCSWAQ